MTPLGSDDTFTLTDQRHLQDDAPLPHLSPDIQVRVVRLLRTLEAPTLSHWKLDRDPFCAEYDAWPLLYASFKEVCLIDYDAESVLMFRCSDRMVVFRLFANKRIHDSFCGDACRREPPRRLLLRPRPSPP